jgi:hypothetical protein
VRWPYGKRREDVKIFFDNCTSPVLASTLDGFVSHRGHHAFHTSDLPCGRSATDVERINYLASDGPDRIIITGDGRIYKNKAERAAYRAAGLRGFVLAPAYQKTPLNQVASVLIWRWPDLENLVTIVAGPTLYELPISRAGKISALPL